jgi:hypothetical protein
MRMARWLQQRYRATSSSLFSSEMQARLASAMSANTGKGLWQDEVSSRLACPMDADIVFGDGSDGNAPLLVIVDEDEIMQTIENESVRETTQPTIARSSTAAIEQDWIEQKAREIKDAAAKLVEGGAVPEALATLQRGIDTMIGRHHCRASVPVKRSEAMDDNAYENLDRPKSRRGFNYSRESHALATRLQVLERGLARQHMPPCKRFFLSLSRLDIYLYVRRCVVNIDSVRTVAGMNEG